MSGHSKWHSIKHKKGAADAARGKIFTRHARLIEIAAREGGSGDPDMNPGLSTAIENAKAENVPNANIDRAIKKGTGALKGDAIEAIIYEAYAPGGVACIIEGFTDNKKRTLSNVRSIIERRGGKWAESGSVMYMFEQKGILVAKGKLNEDTELKLIDAGTEDIEEINGMITVKTEATAWAKARDILKESGLEILQAGMKYVAMQEVQISNENTAKKLLEFIEQIEEDDDVSEVHSNADISDDIIEKL